MNQVNSSSSLTMGTGDENLEGKPNSEQPNQSNNSGKHNGKQPKDNSQSSDAPKEEYIHVRARRGQATNSHSLAERVSIGYEIMDNSFTFNSDEKHGFILVSHHHKQKGLSSTPLELFPPTRQRQSFPIVNLSLFILILIFR